MIPAVAFVLLLIATMAWTILPLIPAIRELLWPTDATPLTQVGHDAGDLAIFADGFRRYLERELLPATGGEGSQDVSQQLRDGTPILQLEGRPDLLKRVSAPDGTIGRLVMTTQPITFPGRETFLYEVYARENFVGGPDAVYRALLTERDAELGARSQVLRWLHVEGNAVIGDDVDLEGRASCAGTMWLGSDVRFKRIRASRVVVGRNNPPVPTAMPLALSSTMRLPRTARQLRGFIRVDGDLTIPSGATFVGTLVVHGDMTIGDDARVAGSVKAHGDCTLGARASVDGAVVARGDVQLGEASRVGAPVIAEGIAIVGPGATIGRPDAPSSLTAEHVTLHLGAQIFGAVSARTGLVSVR
jgi:predicted acyltransferase (DUF342 family)